jgi:multimeric flavodoxin WrbA
MKSVTVFVGSARKSGFTHAAARQFLDNLQSFGDVQGEIVFLSEYNLGLCRGCKVCFLRGEEHCPLKGDRDALIEKMMSSDGIVFASPNYSFHVSAIMKAFLDRLGFLFHRPRFHGKTFTDIVVQGFYGGGKMMKYLEFAGGGLGFNVVKGGCITALEPMGEKERRKTQKTLAGLCRRFHERMSKPAFPPPSLIQLMVFRMGRTAVRLELGDDDRDYTYYRDKGWFDSSYFYPTKLALHKKMVGAAFDRLATRAYMKRKGQTAVQRVFPERASKPPAREDDK